MRIKATTAGLLMALAAGPVVAQEPIEYFNQYSTLTNKQFGASAIGWYYTPTSSFFLTGIRTRFNDFAPSEDRNVVAELWTDRGAMGGSLLRSGTFLSSLAWGGFGGASFDALWLEAGVTYFMGFRNVAGLGRNSTDDGDSNTAGHLYYSSGDPNLGNYEKLQALTLTYNPTFALDGYQQDNARMTATPEPATMVLMATGLLGMAAVGYRKRRRANQA